MTQPARFPRWRPASSPPDVGGRLSDRTEWRLTAHFFRAMFDFGILSQAGADSFKHMLLGAAGGFLAFGLLLTRAYAKKYAALTTAASPEPYRRAVVGDDLFMIGLAMLVVAFVTLLVSGSLFPDERDFRILGPLPVPKTVVFGTKLAGLLLFNSLFIAAAHVSLVPLMLLTSVNSWAEHAVLWRLMTWAIASVTASAFAVLAVTAIIGVLVLLSGRWWHALSAMMRSVMLAGLVLCVPLVFDLPTLGASLTSGSPWLALLPPAWFVGLQRVLLGSVDPWLVRLAGIALAAVAAAAVIVIVTYTRLFRHFERLMLRSTAMSPLWLKTDRTIGPSRATSLDSARPPAFRAVYWFTIATLGRSHLHQSVLIGLSACGAGIVVNRLMGADLASAAMWTPFALMFACGLGVRAALALPMEHRANWIFRLTEDEATRGDELRAVDRVVTVYVVGVPVAPAIPVFWVTLGPTAVIAALVVALVGLVFVHAVLLEWRRIPFTCSYLPGKRFAAQSLLLGLVAFLLFTLAGRALVQAATADVRHALVIATALSLIAWWLRRGRLAIWSETPLMFEDEFPDQPQQLRL